jgi:hypothetical protein
VALDNALIDLTYEVGLSTAVLTPSSIATAIASTMTGVWMAKPSHA